MDDVNSVISVFLVLVPNNNNYYYYHYYYMVFTFSSSLLSELLLTIFTAHSKTIYNNYWKNKNILKPVPSSIFFASLTVAKVLFIW